MQRKQMTDIIFILIFIQMKIPINSIVINDKWRIKKSIFHTQNKLFIQAYDPKSENTLAIFLLVTYNQFIQQPLLKFIHNIKSKNKQNSISRIIMPDKPTVQSFGKCKMFAMHLNQRPISLYELIKQKKYSLSIVQIIETAISGINSLAELHSYGLVHGKITTKTCYYSNRLIKMQLRKSLKSQLMTYFGICIVDIQKFQSKVFNQKEQIEQLLYEPCSKALGLKNSFKDDIESIIYILIKLATGQQIFSIQRYFNQWNSQQAIRKWKLYSLYEQIVCKTPKQLQVLVQIYLSLQQLNGEMPNYTNYLKKLWKKRQSLLGQEKGKQTKYVEDHTIDILKTTNFQNFQQEVGSNNDQIFQENIKIDIRCSKTGFDSLKF